ncbi:autotransporter outer membrane beta-barrel domain-containing protein [Burkholderia sp. WAC0059]|nr:autotransporter outer membrane beta-barrel domain-containing protein [Burkholderia sp. WAC0059]
MLIDAGAIASAGANISIASGSVVASVPLSVSNAGTIGTAIEVGLYNDASNVTIINSGTISSGNGLSITNSGAGTLADIGLYNVGAISALTNNRVGAISGSQTGLVNSGTIGTLINNGTIHGGGSGLVNAGTIGTLTNAGTISSSSDRGLQNQGVIGTLTNTGTIYSGGWPGLTNYDEIDALTNSGLIYGNELDGFENFGTIGTLDNTGTIAGHTGPGIVDAGAIGTLTNSGTISSGTIAGGWGGSDSAGLYNFGGTISVLNNTSGGLISGSPVAGGTSVGIYNGDYGTIGALTNTANSTISGGQSGLYNEADSTIGTLTNNGVISGGTTGVDNSGTIDTLTNGGTIVAGPYGLINEYGGETENGALVGGTIGTLSNTGLISGTSGIGIGNAGEIAQLDNAAGATISGSLAIDNVAVSTIGTLANGGLISGSVGILNTGTIGNLTNSGTIAGTMGAGVRNATYTSGTTPAATTTLGAIGTLTNTGTISGTQTGVGNAGSIGTLTNRGLITGATDGIANTGTIGTLTNAAGGTIAGGRTGLYNSGTIGALTNAGLVTGSLDAIDLAGGAIGPLVNTGVIAGNIENQTANDLTIVGGTGTVSGTLTGYGGANTVGTIGNSASNLVFASGNELLNDDIDVGSHAVKNAGAVLEVNQPVTITGNYSQGANATLQIGVAGSATTQGSIATDSGYGRLVVTGNATLAPDSNVTLRSNGYAFAAGQRYVVVDTAGAADYGGATAAGNAPGLNYSAAGYAGQVSGRVVASGSHNDLVLTVDSATPVNPPPPSEPSTPSTPPASSDGSPPTSTATASPPPPAPPAPTDVATEPNARSALGGLLGYTGVGSAQLLNLYDAALGSLSQGSVATANRVGQQLGTLQTGEAAIVPTFDALGVVNAHVNALRLGQGAGVTGISTGDSPRQWTLWGEGYGGHGNQSAHEQAVDGYAESYGGLLVGADRLLGEHWRAGGAFSYSDTSIDGDGDIEGDRANVNGYGLIGYAGYAGDPWYANLSMTVVQQQYDTTRQVGFTGFSGTAGGHFSGQQYAARAEAGWPLAVYGATLTPVASLTYSYLHQGGYTENGGDGAALSVGTSHVSSVESGLGAKLSKAFATRYGQVVPEFQVQWLHEYDHDRQWAGVNFAADPDGTAFTTAGVRPVSDLADISFGVTLLNASNVSLSARYEVQAGGGFVSQTGILRLQHVF